MKSEPQVLISLEEIHASNILRGTKRVELRRRPMHIDVGTVVWMYVKKPVGSIVGHAVVKATHHLSPHQLWDRFSSCSGLTRKDFFAYFDGLDKAFALELKTACKLPTPMSLEELRTKKAGFHPPQFYLHLDGALSRALSLVASTKSRQVSK